MVAEMRAATLAFVIAMALVIVFSCGMAMRATGRDNACTEQGGHLEGMIEMRCVIP